MAVATEVLGACIDTRCASLFENQGKSSWDAGFAERCCVQLDTAPVRAVGRQRHRPADGNGRFVPRHQAAHSATSTGLGWMLSRAKRESTAGRRLLFGRPAPRADGYLAIHANTMDIQSCGSGRRIPFPVGCGSRRRRPRKYGSYLVDPASSHMLVSKIKPCMSKYKLLYTVKLRMAH